MLNKPLLTESEKVAVCFVLKVEEFPDTLKDKTFAEIMALYTEDKPHVPSFDRRGHDMLCLRDEIDVLLGLKRDTIKQLTEQRDDAREDHRELKLATETLIYKIKDVPDNKVETLYEFKEVKALLGVY